MTDTEPPRLQHDYEPWGVCAQAIESRAPEVLISGPAGTGKSRACLEKVMIMALNNPGMRGLFVRKTRESLTSTALITWRRDVIPELIEGGVCEFYGGSREQPAQYRFANGSTIELGGMDKPTKIMSSEYDIIYVQEAIELTVEDWESLTTRLRSNIVSFQQLIADCNPASPKHWLKQRADAGHIELYESRHEDNPTLYTRDGELTDEGAKYMAKLDALTGPRHQRYRLGLWVQSEGVIYPGYDPAIHLIDRFPIPEDWQRWWTIDFGFVNPYVCQHWAETPDGVLILYREYYGTRRLVSEWANLILNDITDTEGEWIEPRPVEIICDHDAEGRETFERIVGYGTVPAIKRVLDGIQAVQERLAAQRILFMRDSLRYPDEELRSAAKPAATVEEFGGYVWADSKAKEQPLKADDHGADAMRYLVAEHDLGARPNVRWLTVG